MFLFYSFQFFSSDNEITMQSYYNFCLYSCYRLEQEKLAHKLERACSPTQDVVGAEFLDGEFSEEEEDVNEVELEDPNPVVTHEV